MNKYFPIFIVLLSILWSCGETGEKLKQELLPTAVGEVGEIVLITDSIQWVGDLGDQLKETLRAPMVGLPQDEPLFAVRKVNPNRFNSLLKKASNLIFVMTLDSKTQESRVLRRYFTDQSLKKISQDSSLWMTIREDEFAKDQLALYLYGQDEASLIKKIRENEFRIRGFIESVEQKRIKRKLLKSREKGIEDAIAESQGVSIEIPFGWDMAKDLPNFSWVRFLEVDKEMDVFIYQEPYRDVAIFDDIGAFRDRITEQYLRDSEKSHLYIQRQEIVPVFEEKVNFQGSYAVKARGLWKNSDSSGGGPFVSYTIVDQENQRVFYVEGYVYSPGTQKKTFIREIDAILSTFRFENRTS